MRKMAVLLAPLAALLLCAPPAPAQEIAGGIIFSRHRNFKIPFGDVDGRVKQLQLYLSTDLGRSWQPSAVAPPDQKHFRFVSDRDGYFWFAVQTQDQEGRHFPASMDGAEPSLKVVIDTVAPQLNLQPLAPRGGEVGVAWEIRDDNLDLTQPDAVRLEYRTPLTGGGWITLKLPVGGAQFYWNPSFTGAVEVRLHVRDRAGNTQTAATTINPASGGAGSGGFTPTPISDPPLPPFGGPSDAERRLVGSKRINLNYELKEVGPSGVSLVELWYTMDGRSWSKYPLKFGEDPTQKSIAFDVVGEGLYGITLVAKSGVGLGERAPQAGDRPQIWIEVDLTRPEVKLHSVMVGTGPEKGKLSIAWSAKDKNLHKDPITLSYAEAATGPWTPIAAKIPNTGRHVWTMPERVPYQFYLKVEASDAAGNTGEAITDSMIKVDLSHPKVKILNVEPATP